MHLVRSRPSIRPSEAILAHQHVVSGVAHDRGDVVEITIGVLPLRQEDRPDVEELSRAQFRDPRTTVTVAGGS